MDVFTKLAALVGIEFKPEMLGREHMLANCARFVDSLLGHCPYIPTAPAAEMTLLENILREMAFGMVGKSEDEWWRDAQRAAWRYANEFEVQFRHAPGHVRFGSVGEGKHSLED